MEPPLLSHYCKENNVYMVDVAVDNLNDFFSKHDPAFINERDLNPALAKYITDQMIIFPNKANVQIRFHLPKKFKRLEKGICRAFSHHFEFEYLDSQLHIKRRLAKAKNILSFAVIIFVSLMSGSYVLDHYLPDFWIWQLLAEGLFVGSWVAMWHPIQMLLYEWLPLHENKKMYERLMNMKLCFKYK